MSLPIRCFIFYIDSGLRFIIYNIETFSVTSFRIDTYIESNLLVTVIRSANSSNSDSVSIYTQNKYYFKVFHKNAVGLS